MTTTANRSAAPLARAMALLLTAAAATAASAQDLGLKAPPQQIPVVIYNATIHPVSAPAIPIGAIEFDRGIITRITPGETPDDAVFTADKTYINARGRHVYPGLISSNTQLGLQEMAAIRATNDINEAGSVHPEARAIVAVNPDSTLLPVTRANGILIAGVFPEGGRIAGRAGAIRLDGWTWEQMAIQQDIGLVIEWPSMRTIRAWWMDVSDEDQQREIRQSLAAIDDTVKAAQAYADAKAANPATPADLRLDAILPCLTIGTNPPKNPVFIYAADLDQITAAVTWATERKLRPVIVGGRDAPLAADLLKKHNVPVIITGTHTFPKRADSPYDDAFTLPKRLLDAGITFAIASADRTGHERNLPYNAATAVAYGLPVDDAIKSLTLWPATILGIATATEHHPGYGSLEVGKSATLIVTTDNPLEITANTTHAFIDGRQIDLTSKQTVLAEKYREKYRQLKLAPPPTPPPTPPPAPR